MDAYTYRAGFDAHVVLLEEFEGHMLSGLSPFSNLESGVLVVHKPGIVRTIERSLLVAKAHTLLTTLQAQAEHIQYTYGLVFDDGAASRSAGGAGCTFNGERAIVESGPGYCHIVATDFFPLTEEQMVTLAKENGIARASVPATTKLTVRRVLRDLRDMQIAPLDGMDGAPKSVRATRRRKPTEIIRKLADLIAFLETSTAQTVDVSVIVRYNRPPEIG